MDPETDPQYLPLSSQIKELRLFPSIDIVKLISAVPRSDGHMIPAGCFNNHWDEF